MSRWVPTRVPVVLDRRPISSRLTRSTLGVSTLPIGAGRLLVEAGRGRLPDLAEDHRDALLAGFDPVGRQVLPGVRQPGLGGIHRGYVGDLHQAKLRLRFEYPDLRVVPRQLAARGRVDEGVAFLRNVEKKDPDWRESEVRQFRSNALGFLWNARRLDDFVAGVDSWERQLNELRSAAGADHHHSTAGAAIDSWQLNRYLSAFVMLASPL